MLDFGLEKKLFNQGYRLIGAVDEAGRGPLAGPVVAACVVFGPNFKIDDELKKVNDSKKVKAEDREELYQVIVKKYLAVGIGVCNNKTIDKINILQASFLAMKKALGQIKQKPEFIILDGKFKIPNLSIAQAAIIRGDETVFSIAAASIIAKVARDRLMMLMHQAYPNYGFNLHKGYGTKLHLERLEQFGPCPIHRLSFKSVKTN